MLTILALANVPCALSSTAPYISSITPHSASKDGGTRITVLGAGFEETPDLNCKFTRLDPDSDQIVEKETCGTFISSTEISCDSPMWDEATCPLCDPEEFGSTCPQVTNTCANAHAMDQKNSVANVLYDREAGTWVGGERHHLAADNHHSHAGMVGPKGKFPCPTCANEWDPVDNPNGQHAIGKRIRNGVATTFYGHTGSQYIRTDDFETDTEISRGQFIKLRNQFFTVARIERCNAEVGCFCTGHWAITRLTTNDTTPSGQEPDVSNYPIGELFESKKNSAMYNYDMDAAYWDGYSPPTCVGGVWASGTKITLDQPVYRPPGTPNMNFTTNEVFTSSKKPCVDCKCKEGCPMTMTVTTDGRTWSGGGTNGKIWHGSGAKFTAKFQVPEVHKITFPDLDGPRDSTRMFLPATGNTRIRLHGDKFQKGPLLRCYFDTPRIMVKAEFIDEQTVECITPQWVARRQDLVATRFADNMCLMALENLKFFAPDISDMTDRNRLYDSQCTDSKQNGATVFTVDDVPQEYSYSHVQVTNNGMVRDLSNVVHQRADGANSYIEGIGSPHRSTCYQHEYPSRVVSANFDGDDMDDSAVQPNHEGSEPCRASHKEHYQEGNDVQIKYATCYEAQNAESTAGTNYYGANCLGLNGNGVTCDTKTYPNATHSLGQLFSLPLSAAGPLVAIDLHLEKEILPATNAACWDPKDCAEPDRRETVLEVCISAGGFAGGTDRLPHRDASTVGTHDGAPQIFDSADYYAFNTSGHILACEQITIQSIKPDANKKYTVYFKKAPYLLGFDIYDQGANAHSTNADQNDYATSGINPQTASAGTNIFDAVYFLTLSHVSGPATVSWAMSDQQYADTNNAMNPTFATDGHFAGAAATNAVPVNKISQVRNPQYGDQNGYVFDWATNSTISTGPSNSGFRARFYTCDGCRWEYVSDAGSDDTYQIGGIYGRQNYSETYLQTHNAARCTSNEAQTGGRPHADWFYSTNEGLPRQNSAADPTGSRGDECGTPTYREQLAQAIRPTEDITLTKMKTKMRAAYASTSGLGGVHGHDHNQRTENGDFQSANGATVSVWITKYGKMGESVCRSFTGTTRVGDDVLQGDPTYGTDSGYLDNYDNGTLLPGHQSNNFNQEDEILGCGIDNKNCMTCDINNDGVYSELCFTGARCNSSRTDIFGGCGVGGVCDMAEVVPNGHYLRNQPAGAGPTTDRCGNDVSCQQTQGLKVAHSVKLEQAASATDWKDVVFEFEKPVVLDKHTTYYVNMAVDETISNSDSVYWYGGTQAPRDQATKFSRHQFLGAYQRVNLVVDGMMTYVWIKAKDPAGSSNPFFFNLEIQRCVTALPMIKSLTASGEGTGSCSTRSSPRGGDKAPMITFTGRNFYPSKNLRVVWLYEDGTMGPTTECETTNYQFTEMKCKAPAFDPHRGEDCSVPGNCNGVHVMATNDGINYGPELFSPKFIEPYRECIAYKSETGTCGAAVPASINGSHPDADHFVQQLGMNVLKHCFTNIYISVSGDDFRGDGSRSRPFRTLQRGIDACNENDIIILLPGTYTGTGNRGLRHMGKKIEVIAVEAGDDHCGSNGHSHTSQRDVTIIDCEHYPDGFVLNNNKDSDSPFAGYIDFSGVTTRNCENLRIYY